MTIVQAGLAWTADTFFAATAVCFFIGFLVALVFVWWILALAVGAVAVPADDLCIASAKQAPASVRNAISRNTGSHFARSASGTHSVAASKWLPRKGRSRWPASFEIATDEINFGLSLPHALLNFADRVPLADIRFFVTAVLIQRETGGNLTEILGNISALIRERLRLLPRTFGSFGGGPLLRMDLIACRFRRRCDSRAEPRVSLGPRHRPAR